MRTSIPRALAAAAALLAAALAAPLAAQQPQINFPRLSPGATVTQTIGVTEVTIRYSRPGVKGQKIWGELVPDNVEKIAPYEPGKPISDVERELGLSGVIKLASNENPLGPSPKGLAAATAAMRDIHLYPDGSGHRLRQADRALLEDDGVDGRRRGGGGAQGSGGQQETGQKEGLQRTS